MLKRQLEETRMQEGESMDAFLTKIKDFKEQLLNIDEVISDKQLVSKVLAALLDSYQGFATTIRLLTRGKESFNFDELISLLLQESQSRANRDVLIVVIKLLLPLPSSKANKDENKITFLLKAMMPRLSMMRRRR